MGKPKVVDLRPELPHQPQLGRPDQNLGSVRSAIVALTAARQVMGHRPRARSASITREDPFHPGGGRRLFVDGPPFCFATNQVELRHGIPRTRRRVMLQRT